MCPEEVIVEYEGMERSLAHPPATERESLQDQSLLVFGEGEPLTPADPTQPCARCLFKTQPVPLPSLCCRPSALGSSSVSSL